MAQKGKIPSSPANPTTEMSTDSGDELNLRHLHCRETTCRCMNTATSTTVKKLQLRHLHEYLQDLNHGHLSSTTTGMEHDLHNRDIDQATYSIALCTETVPRRRRLTVEPRSAEYDISGSILPENGVNVANQHQTSSCQVQGAVEKYGKRLHRLTRNETSKTSHEHVTATIDDERGHINMAA